MLAHLTHHLVTALPTPLLPFIRDEFALDYTRAGLVISAFGVVYGVSQLPAGWLADRIGPHAVITLLGMCGVAVAGLLAGLSQSYAMLLTVLVLMGILGGGYHPAATTIIAVVAETKSRGRAMGFHMIGGSMSFFLIPLIAAGIAAAWGWRAPFIIIAIPTIIFGLVFYLQLRRQYPTKKAPPRTTSAVTGERISPARLRRLITIIFLGTFSQAVIMSTTSLIPLYLVDNFNASKETAAASLSLVYMMGLWAGPVGGYLSDRWGRVLIILGTGFITGPVIYLFNVVPYGVGIAAILAVLGIIIYVNTTAAQAYIVDQSSERNRATLLGIYFFGTMEGSGVLPPIIGYLIDQFGFYTSFSIIGAVVFTVTLASTIVLRASRDQG